MQGKITKRSVDALAPKSRDYFLWDAQIPGFGVRVSPKGRKTYVVQYRAGGRTRRMSLGVHGAITPDQARGLAREASGSVAQGDNPAETIARDRRAPNVSALCDQFLARHVRVHLKETTQREYTRCCELFINPRLGAMRVQDITRADIAALHSRLADKPYQANRVLGVLSKMFNLAEVWGLRPDNSNPTRHVQKYKERKRERFLSLEEISTLFAVLDTAVAEETETPHVAAAFKLLLLTGCRLSEIQKMKWVYVRDDSIFLPDAKTGPRRVLLSANALAILENIERRPGNPFVIVGEVEGQHVTDLQKPWRRIRQSAGLDDVRIHDLRHTYASMAAMDGLSLPQIGKLLGHTQPQTTQRYAHLADQFTRKAVAGVDAIFTDLMPVPAPATAEKRPMLRVVADE